MTTVADDVATTFGIDESQPNVKFNCPFCGLGAFAGFFDDGDYGVLHAEPPCALFCELEPDEYLHKCNRFGLQVEATGALDA